MDKMDYVIIASTFLSIPVMSLLFSLEFDKLHVTGYYVGGTEDITVFAIIVLLIVGLIFVQMVRYLHITKELMDNPRERRSVELLELSFANILLVTFGMVIAYIWYLLTGYSESYFNFLGIKIYLYPVLAGFGTIASFASLIYSAMFAMNEFRSPVSGEKQVLAFLIYLVFWFFAVLPYNYYALYPPTNGLYTRWVVFSLHVLFGLLVAVFAGYTIFKRAVVLSDANQKMRLKLIGFGFTIYPLIFVPPIMGVLIFRSIPMLVWYTLSYVVLLIASVLIYLGYATPSWLEKNF